MIKPRDSQLEESKGQEEFPYYQDLVRQGALASHNRGTVAEKPRKVEIYQEERFNQNIPQQQKQVKVKKEKV